MNARQITALYLLNRTRSVSETARLMNLSQPAVSKIIRSIEVDFGILLFDHRKGSLTARDELQEILPSIERIYQNFLDLRLSVTQLKNGGGTLTISSTATSAVSIVMPACRNLLASKFQTNVTIREGNECFYDVAESQSIIGVTPTIMDHADVIAKPIATASMVCVLSDRHEFSSKTHIDIKDLNRNDIIIYPPHKVNSERIYEMCRQSGFELQPMVIVNQAVLACMFAKELNGIAIVDSLIYNERIFEGMLIKSISPEVDYTIYALWKRRRASLGQQMLLAEIELAAKATMEAQKSRKLKIAQ